MKVKIVTAAIRPTTILCLVLASGLSVINAFSQNSVFTYQGRVTDNGTNYNGTGQFKFALVTVTNFNHAAVAIANAPSGGFITGYTVGAGGNGYVTAPAVTVIGGGGSGAAAVAHLTGDTVTSLSVVSPGDGNYTNAPIVLIAPPPPSNSYATFWSNDGTSAGGSEPGIPVIVPVNNGLFTVALGDTNLPNMAAMDATLFSQPNLDLRIWFSDGANNFAALDPAQNLTPAPYAIFANTASNLPPSAQLDVIGLSIQNNPGTTPNVIGGSAFNFVTAGIAGATIGGGGGEAGRSNSVTAPFATVSGGGGNSAGGTDANIAGGFDNSIQLNANDSDIAGGQHNTISNGAFYATIGGGYGNNISSPWASIGGGGYNAIGNNCNSGTVSGGFGNTIADNTHDSTIGGGSFSSIGTNSFASTIAGGSYNSTGANSFAPAIAGGSHNSIGTNASVATIGGGTNNAATAFGATVSGGAGNSATAWSSTVGGGAGNIASSPDGSATVSGGFNNTASGDSSTVSGGASNLARGSYSAIPGGKGNFAAGSYSLAAGNSAEALDDGAFVWADNSPGFFHSTGSNQFLIRATGGVGINTATPTGLLTISTGTGSLSVQKDGPVPALVAESSSFSGTLRIRNHLEVWPNAAGSADGFIDIRGTNGNPNISLDGESGNITCISLNQTSDRNAKTDCAPINPTAVLAKVAALPITQWAYKTDSGARHIGPMAQDFHAAFGLNGKDDKHITTVDEGGIALAAIQGLNRKLDTENAELKKEVLQLTALVQQLNRELNSQGKQTPPIGGKN